MLENTINSLDQQRQHVEANHLLAEQVTAAEKPGLQLGFSMLDENYRPIDTLNQGDPNMNTWKIAHDSSNLLGIEPDNSVSVTKKVPKGVDIAPEYHLDTGQVSTQHIVNGTYNNSYGHKETVQSKHVGSAGAYKATTVLESMTTPTTDLGTISTAEVHVTRPGYEHVFKDPTKAAQAAHLITKLAAKHINQQ